MLLGKISKDVKVSLSCKVDQTVSDDLAAYKEFYQMTYGEEVSQSSIVEELLKVVLLKDKKFQTFKKQNKTP